MAKKSFFDTKTVKCDDGVPIRLSYYFLRENEGLCNSYGALVEMERGSNWESAAVGKITTSAQKMEKLLELLCRNSVTPCTLREVVLEEMNKF